jgi:hypothetical protein
MTQNTKPEFNFENIRDFMIWLTEYYTKKFNAPWDAVEGKEMFSITKEESEALYSKTLDGFTAHFDKENNPQKFLYINFTHFPKNDETGDFIRDAETGEPVKEPTADYVPSELFDQYMREKFPDAK